MKVVRYAKPRIRLHVHVGVSSGQLYWKCKPWDFGPPRWHLSAREAMAACTVPAPVAIPVLG